MTADIGGVIGGGFLASRAAIIGGVAGFKMVNPPPS
jgi:hypothetical protein